MTLELQTIYDARQSFYGKATVRIEELDNFTAYVLLSYGVEVASVEKHKDFTQYFYNGNYSQTTTRHQKEFFKQNGLNNYEIKKLFKKGQLIKVVKK